MCFHDVPGMWLLLADSSAVPELIEDLHSLLRSGLRSHDPYPLTVMPSAHFCLLPLHVAIQGASCFLMIALTPLT